MKKRRTKKRPAKPKTFFRYFHISPTPELKKLTPYIYRHGNATDEWMERWEPDKKKELSAEARRYVREHIRRVWFYETIVETCTCFAEFAESFMYIYCHETKKKLSLFEGRPVSKKPVPVRMIGEIKKTRVGNTRFFEAELECYEHPSIFLSQKDPRFTMNLRTPEEFKASGDERQPFLICSGRQK